MHAVSHRHPCGVWIEHLQTLCDIGHADAHAIWMSGGFRRIHADAVIFHFDHQLLFFHPTADDDAAALDLGRQPVLDRVLDQRLQDHAGDVCLERLGIKLLADPELLAEADDFDVEIIVDELHFFAQLHKGLLLIQEPPQNASKFEYDGPRRVRAYAH